MPALDRSRFVRILSLTDSPIDAEALNAVRRANAMLQTAGLSWDKLIVVPAVDAGSETAEEMPDPLWADAWMFSAGNWPDPTLPPRRRRAWEQAGVRLRRLALRLQRTLRRTSAAATAFASHGLDELRRGRAGALWATIVRALRKARSSR